MDHPEETNRWLDEFVQSVDGIDGPSAAPLARVVARRRLRFESRCPENREHNYDLM